MVIYPQTIKLQYSPKLKELFIQNGINNCTKGLLIEIDILKLNNNSKKEILCKCDNCGQLFYKKFVDIFKENKNINLNLLLSKITYCKNKKCIEESRKNTCIIKYGVENISQLQNVKEKIKQTNLNKYGVENVSQSEEIQKKIKQTNLDRYGVDSSFKRFEIREKIKQTNLNKYGVENVFQSVEIKEKIKQTLSLNYGENITNPSQSYEIREKIKQTNLNKYGVENVFQSVEIKEKIKQTNLTRYGVEHVMFNDEIKNKAIKNSFKTLYINGTGKISKQQKYIGNIMNGELNYPIENSKFILDIAFPNEKLYIEYDGSGHDLGVRLGKMTYSQLKQRDVYREIFMRKLGWKIIRIISLKDKLPNEIDLKNILETHMKLLSNTDNSWFYIDFDNSVIYGDNYNVNITCKISILRKGDINEKTGEKS